MLRISYKKGIAQTHVTREPIKCCLGGNYSEASLDLGYSDTTDNSNTEATVDLKLPRRSLLVTFTCNSCGDRTKRLINRLAYERGTVFVQGQAFPSLSSMMHRDSLIFWWLWKLKSLFFWCFGKCIAQQKG